MNEKIEQLARIWCKWNAWELESKKAMCEIGSLFDEETKEVWNTPEKWEGAKEGEVDKPLKPVLAGGLQDRDKLTTPRSNLPSLGDTEA